MDNGDWSRELAPYAGINQLAHPSLMAPPVQTRHLHSMPSRSHPLKGSFSLSWCFIVSSILSIIDIYWSYRIPYIEVSKTKWNNGLVTNRKGLPQQTKRNDKELLRRPSC